MEDVSDRISLPDCKAQVTSRNVYTVISPGPQPWGPFNDALLPSGGPLNLTALEVIWPFVLSLGLSLKL